jgi:hypothetical protein
MIFLSIGLYILSVLFQVWAVNLSFAAHVQENAKDLKKYHVSSVAIMLLAVTCLFVGTLLLV